MPVKKALKSAGTTKFKAVTTSKERSGVSLGVLKKALVAANDDLEKNSIKLGLERLVSKGTLMQTRGTVTLGSFKLNKNMASWKAKPKAKKAGTAKPKKSMGSGTSKKKAKKTSTNVRVAAGTKKAKSPEKVKTSKAKEAAKRQAKTRKKCSCFAMFPIIS